MIERFEMRHFFGAGVIIFIIVCIGNIFTISRAWDSLWLSAKVTGCAMIFFYFMLILVFYKNYTTSKIPTPEISEEELDKIIKS